jgi:hypothetical protein
VSVSYSGVLFDGRTREHFFSIDPPRLDGKEISWRAEPLHCEMTLRRRAPRYAKTLLDVGEGRIVWQCEMPDADAHVRIGGRDLRGRGYAELLEMTIPPWRLPIDELRWGRYGGDGVSLVWIDWQGSHPLHVVLLNGAPVDGGVRNGSVVAEDLTLAIDGGSVVRDAPLRKTLEAIPLLKHLLPERLLRVEEKKWCSPAAILRNDIVIDRGWAVHEIVTFA